MPFDRVYYVAKGEQEPTAALVQQADYSIAVAHKYKSNLVEAGLSEGRIAEMVALKEQVAQAMGGQHEEKSTSKQATSEEHRRIDAAKKHIRKIRKLAPLAVRTLPNPDITLDALRAEASLRRQTPVIVAYLNKTRPIVATLSEGLKPYFRGEEPLAVHDRVTAELLAADSTQELAVKSRPETTLKLNEAKGRLLEAIEDLNRIGQLEFDGQAEIIAQFNKDILLRARRSRGSSKDSEKPAA